MIYDNLVIGGGFFGLYLSNYLARMGKTVLLVEKESDFMRKASYNNQARVHNGYHYPRSVLTALRSRISFPRFVNDFSDCIDSSFDKYYAVGKILGKVTGRQFELFCKTIGAPCSRASSDIENLFNPNLIENVFRTTEYAFDSIVLKELILNKIADTDVHLRLNTKVQNVKFHKLDQTFVVECDDLRSSQLEYKAKQIFNCTYSHINQPIQQYKDNFIPLKHELTEMSLIEVPDELKRLGITIMCGPFFSVMPFPSMKAHTLSHVRYTPHFEWLDDSENFIAPDKYLKTKPKSFFGNMIKDASRYMPILERARYKDSLWEVKTTLPRSELDDGRPILLKANHIYPGFHCVMGGKIDNVYDMIIEMEKNRNVFKL